MPSAPRAATEPFGTRLTRRALIALSRVLMLPAFRIGHPPRASRWGGSICVLRTRGRVSGLVREAPLDYAPTADGILVLAGFGRRTRWLGNVVADPHVEVDFPDGRRIMGTASEIADPDARLAAIRAVLCHCGVVGYVYGFSPFTVSDDRLTRAARDIVAVHVVLDAPPPPSHLRPREIRGIADGTVGSTTRG